MDKFYRFFLHFGLFAVLLTACAPSAAVSPTADLSFAYTQAYETALAGLQLTSTPIPIDTFAPPTAVRTPPALPITFTASQLNPMDIPHTYIQDTCEYLQNKWSSNKAMPGTIVMVVMLHGIVKDAVAKDPEDITAEDFGQMMNDLKEQGFEAINATQMADFVDHNTKIPMRSVLIIQDDRKTAENFNDHFRLYHDQWGWPVVNAWISLDDSIRALRLQENIALEAEGWVDHQSHGYIHNTNMSDDSTDEFIKTEFERSVADLQQNFNKTPVAIIWPGGNFGIRPVQFARQYGFRLGFTINPRGPVMFNWIPLADQADPARPAYLPEGYVNDPRMVMPRYWPYQVQANLDIVRNIGKEAAVYAEQNRAVELEYYDIMCASILGPIP
jgi:polysaccharide deacetylase